jgi:hypothetical protein
VDLRRIGPVVVCAFALGGCGGGGAASGGPTVPSTLVAGKVVLTIPPSTSAAARKPQYISPSSVSLSTTVNGGTPIIADISSSSPDCTTSEAGRTCTVPLMAPAARDSFVFSQYDAANATGHLLATATVISVVTAGQPFQVSAVMNGVVAAVELSLGTAPPAGTPGSTSLTVNAEDSAGNTIIGPGNYSTPITLTVVDPTGQTTLSTSSVSAPGTPVTINYAGGLGVNATITGSATGATSAMVHFMPSGGGLNLYVAEFGNSTMTVTPAGSNGNVAPIRTVGGSNTQMSQLYGIAVDGSGTSYLSDLRAAIVTEYAPGANGNVAPVNSITGGSTGLSGPLGLAIDSAGDLICANFFANTITVYAPGASGNATPIRTIAGGNTGLAETYGIALDTTGNLYVVDNISQFGGTDAVTVYAAGANGNVAPLRTITGGNTGMSGAVYDAVDSSGRLYVSNHTAQTITVYAAGANGNAAPIATIGGSNTGLVNPWGVLVDANGLIYVDTNAGGGSDSIVVFTAGANGNVAPLRTIVGPNTGLNSPLDMVLAP